jgi:hypothetical protein
MCRHFREAGDKVVGVVDDSIDAVDGGVGVADGGCASIDGGDVAALGKGGLVTRAGGSSSVWVVVSMVVGDVGVVWMSTLVVVTPSVWVSASSIKTAPRNSALAWAAIERQSPAPCPSVSHFRRSSSFPCCIPSLWPSSSPFLCASSCLGSLIRRHASYPYLYPSLCPSSFPSSCPVFLPVLCPSSNPACHLSSFASSNSCHTSSWL